MADKQNFNIEDGVLTHADQNVCGEVEIPESVTKIGFGAFEGCRGLTGITIPDSVTEIGGSAFEGCSGLTGVTIPESVTKIGGSAFEGCRGLTSITIPESVTEIGGSTFDDCAKLTSVTISEGVTRIGTRVFDGCRALTSVTIPESVTEIGWSAFEGCSGLTSVTIPAGDFEIGWDAFKDCRGLTDIIIQAGNVRMNWPVFEGCTELTSVSLSKDTAAVNFHVFECCTGLTDIYVDTENQNYSSSDGLLLNQKGVLLFCPRGKRGVLSIPEGVTEIGAGAFEDCTGLTGVAIPESVTIIGAEAFSGCRNLSEITIHGQLKKIDDGAFFGCESLTGITIPAGVTEIGSRAFEGCTGLTGITIPAGVTEIGSHAFEGCTGLTGITIPDGVRTIGSRAFYGCAKLVGVTIPESLGSIGPSAFEGCRSLNDVVVPAGISEIGPWAFEARTRIRMTDQSLTEYFRLRCRDVDGIIIEDPDTIHITAGYKPDFSDFYWDGGKYASDRIPHPDEELEVGRRHFYAPRFISCLQNICSVTAVYLTDPMFQDVPALDYIPSGYIPVSSDEADEKIMGISLCIRAPKAVVVDEDNPYLSSRDGILFDKEGTRLIWYPIGKQEETCTIPEGVTQIGPFAFAGRYTGIRQLKKDGTAAVRTYRRTYESVNASDGSRDIVEEEYIENIQMAAKYVFNRNLQQVVLSDTVTVIREGAFDHCIFLESVRFPSGLKRILYRAFNGCKSLREADLPDSLEFIAPFEVCENLKTVNFYGTCCRIREKYWSQSNSGFTVYRDKNPEPYTARYIEQVFPYHETVTVGDENERFAMDGDVILSRDKTEIIYCPRGKSGQYVVPPTVSRICESAFSGCKELTGVRISHPDTVIEDYAFSRCDKLYQVVGSIKDIGPGAFFNCKALEKIRLSCVEHIGEAAFWQCEGLGPEICIPKSADVGKDAFGKCNVRIISY